MSALNVYLASRYSRREELCGYREDLRERGHDAPARWLNGEHQVHGVEAAEAVERDGPVPAAQAVLFATDDVEDINAADVLVAFTEQPRVPSSSRGGRHVELGIALGLRIAGGLGSFPRIVIVGPLENVFTALPHIDGRFDTWTDLLAALDMQPEIHGWSRTGNERCDRHPWHRTNYLHTGYYPAVSCAEPVSVLGADTPATKEDANE